MSASLEKGINALKEQVDSSVASFFSSCVHCGMCAEACLFYTETGEAGPHANHQDRTIAPHLVH